MVIRIGSAGDRGLQTGRFRGVLTFSYVLMFKKILAKLRNSISPSRASKSSPAAPSKPAAASKPHSTAHRGEAKTDRSHGHTPKPAAGHREAKGHGHSQSGPHRE